MSKYNIYLLLPEAKSLLEEKLESVGLTKVSSNTIGDVEFDLYLTAKGQYTTPWWKEQYRGFIPEEYSDITNRSYTATLIATTGRGAYAITMGKAHFYVNEFCDLDFGVDIAQRIGDRTKYKMKNSDFFGGIKDKAITSNTDYYELDFQSGESIGFLKMKPLSEEEWGKAAVTFGNSVQFNNIDVSPGELSEVLKTFDETLLKPPLFPIPRSRRVTNEAQIKELDEKIAQLAEDGAEDLVRMFEYDQFGVSFVFADDLRYKLRFMNMTYELDNTGYITIGDIRDFCTEKGFSFKNIFSDLKVVMDPDGGKTITKPLRELIDYKSEDGYYLRGGRWYQFNQDFVEDLKNRLMELEVSELDFEFNQSDYEAWQKQQGDGAKYKEYFYNTAIANQKGFELHDRRMDYRRNFRFEVCDMYDRDNKTLIVTKRGEPIDLGYAVDQASTVIKLINNGKYKTQQKPIRVLPVRQVKLLLIFKKRITKITSLTDVDSITFQNKINDLYTLCREKGLVLTVTIGYENVK